MTNLTEKEQWEDGVYQIEKTDPVVGGPEGLSNRQGLQLANRTRWLKARIDGLLDGTRSAALAIKLATARAVKLTGDATAAGTFDGSADLSLTVTLADTGVAAGTYGGITLDKKGRATAATTFLPVANGGTGNGSGQAPSATKLATARTINGVPFDGTANIAITDDSKAPLNSPVLTGDPRAPTPLAGDNDTSIATTAFVQAAIAALVNGSPEALNQLNELAAALGNNPNYATDMATALGLKANTASPALTGTPTAPTAPAGTNTAQLATTAFVQALMTSFGLAGNAAVSGNTTNFNDAPVGGTMRSEGDASATATYNWPPTGATGTTKVAFEVFTFGISGGSARLAQIATEVFGAAAGGRGRTFVRVRHDGNWFPWREFTFADTLAVVASTGKFSDLADQAGHWLKGTTAANGWKIAALQNLEATGNVALETVNSSGVTVMSSQGVNDGKGGWRPRLYYTKSGDAAVDRRTYWGGVNDSDVVEFVGPAQVRLGAYLGDATGAALCVKGDGTDGTGGLTVNSFAPTLAMVDRSSGARSSRWKTDSGYLYLEWDNNDNGASWNSSVLQISPAGEIRSLSPNAYRSIQGDYGVFWRNDGNNYWMAITAPGDQHGTFGALRPFVVNMATGQVTNATGLSVPTHPRGNSSTQAASTAHVMDAVGNRTGAVDFFAASSAPTGYLKANGATVSRTTYAALFAVIGTTFGAGDGSTTFSLPDLRGEFIRGWDDGRGVDSGRTFGSGQVSQNLSHSHTATASTAGAHSHTLGQNMDRSPAGDGNAIWGDENYYGTTTQTTSTAGDHTHTITVASNGGTESRPRNLALLACIKF